MPSPYTSPPPSPSLWVRLVQLWGAGCGFVPCGASMKNNGESRSCAVPPLGAVGLWGGGVRGCWNRNGGCGDPTGRERPGVTRCWVMAVGQRVRPGAPYGVSWPQCRPGTRCALGAAGGGPTVPGSMRFNRADCLRGFLLPSVAAKRMGMALLCGRRSAVGCFNDGHRRSVGMEAALLSTPAQPGGQRLMPSSHAFVDVWDCHRKAISPR